MNERAFYIGVEEESAFCVFHPAEGSAAVLMCPPFGWDDICSYRSRRAWAERLAAGGRATLRFDLPGTGDSAGSAQDPSRLEAWTAAVHEAATWVRTTTGSGHTVAIGIGLGGLLGLTVAARGGPIDDLVLWGVPAGGRRLLRELQAFARIEAASIVAAGAPKSPPLPGGVLAPGGFVLSAETQAELEALDLTALSLSSLAHRRILLLGRDGIRVDPELKRHLEAEGAQVDVADGGGYQAMMAPPDLARAPVAVFDRVDRWLAAAPKETKRPERAPAAANHDSIEVAAGTTGVRERPFEVAYGSARLFGVLSEPLGAPPAELAVVLLNAGAIRRVGPNRMWVEIARRWAGQGVTTLRLDLEGIGDATGDGERYTDVSELYAPEFVGQVTAALDALETRGAPHRYMLLGLCSGAFWAFHTALRDDRVSAAVMLNPRVLYWDPDLEPARDARKLKQQFFRARSWGKTLRGENRLDRPRLVALTRRLASRQKAPGAAAVPDVERAFDDLRDAGRRAVLMFCDGEPLREELEEDGLLPPSDRWPNVELERIPGRDHTLRPLWMHEHVHAALDRALAAELERVARPVAAPSVAAPNP